MADFGDILKELKDKTSKDTSVQKVEANTDVSNKILQNHSQFLKQIEGLTIDANIARGGAFQNASRQITQIQNVVGQVQGAVAGSQSAFNLNSVKIDPSTGTGIATALAFSVFPGLAKLYVRGVKALTAAFDEIDPAQLNKLKDSAGGFAAVKEVIGAIQTLKFGGLLKSAILLRFTAKKLGTNLGELMTELLTGIEAGMASGGVNRTPMSLKRMSDAFNGIIDGVVKFMDVSTIGLLGKTLLFKVLAGRIGKWVADGFNKLIAQLPPDSVLQNLENTLTRLHNAFDNVDFLKDGPFKKLLSIGVNLRELGKAFGKTRFDFLLEGFRGLEDIGYLLQRIDPNDFAPLPDIAKPFTKPLITKFANFTTFSKTFNRVPWQRLRVNMKAFHVIGVILKKIGLVFKAIHKPMWTAIQTGLDNLVLMRPKLDKIFKIPLGGFIKLALGMTALGAAVAAVGYAFSFMPPLKQVVAGVVTLGALGGMALAVSKFPPLLAITNGALGIAALGFAVMPFAKAMDMFKGISLANIGILAAGLTTVGIAGAALGAGGPLVYIGAGALAALGFALMPFAKGLALMKGVDMGSIGVLATAIGTVGSAAALMGLGGPLIYIGAGAMAALGFALQPFAKGARDLLGLDFEGFSSWKFLKFCLGLAAGGAALGAGAIGFAIAGLGLKSLAGGLNELTEKLDPKKLAAIGPGLKSLKESISGFGVKALSMFFAGRALKSLGKAIKSLTEDIKEQTLGSVTELFHTFKSLVQVSVDENSLQVLIEGVEDLVDAITELEDLDDSSLALGQVNLMIKSFDKLLQGMGKPTITQKAISANTIPDGAGEESESFSINNVGLLNVNQAEKVHILAKELYIGDALMKKGSPDAGGPMIVNNYNTTNNSTSTNSTSVTDNTQVGQGSMVSVAASATSQSGMEIWS